MFQLVLHVDEQPKEQHSQNLAVMNAVEKDIVVKANGQDASAVEPIFPLEKSPHKSEATDVEKSTGARGLGEGSPKVCSSLWKFFSLCALSF